MHPQLLEIHNGVEPSGWMFFEAFLAFLALAVGRTLWVHFSMRRQKNRNKREDRNK